MPYSQSKEERCPNRANHTPCPDGYSAWHEWAIQMELTHTQELCPYCDLWVIWKPKETNHDTTN